MNETLSPQALEIPNLLVQDWVDAQKWIYRGRGRFGELKEWYWNVPGIVILVREGWQRGLSKPKEWFPRQRWERFHPYAKKLSNLYDPFIHRFSWSLMHSGVYQLIQSRLVITNRLHGHILCLLLKIPHVFLPNSYHKNESFYETWTYQMPHCKFVKEPSEVKSVIKEIDASLTLGI